jgi:hypothetical protein
VSRRASARELPGRGASGWLQLQLQLQRRGSGRGRGVVICAGSRRAHVDATRAAALRLAWWWGCRLPAPGPGRAVAGHGSWRWEAAAAAPPALLRLRSTAAWEPGRGPLVVPGGYPRQAPGRGRAPPRWLTLYQHSLSSQLDIGCGSIRDHSGSGSHRLRQQRSPRRAWSARRKRSPAHLRDG